MCVGRLFTAVFVCLVLGACSGGGGSDGNNNPGGGTPVTYGLSGYVTSAFDDSGIPGVEISLSGSSAAVTTDISGRYSFAGLANGAYTVTAVLADAILIPQSLSITVSGANVTDGDFLALRESIIDSGIEFLPRSFSSDEQLRVSLHPADGGLVYTDSSEWPLKSQALDGSPPVALAGRFESAENVVLYDGSTYWIEGGDLHRMSPAGDTTVLAGGLREPGADVTTDIVVDDAFAYWVDQAPQQSCSPPCNWVIRRISLNGGVVVDLAATDRRVASLAIDADKLYWEEESVEPLDPGCACGSKILSVPKSGGSPVLLVDGSLNGGLPPLPPGFTPASWQPAGGMALSSGDIVFAVSANSTYDIRSVPKSGGVIANLATVATPIGNARNAVIDLAVEGSEIFWLDTGNAGIRSLPLAGGAVSVLADGLVNPGGLAVHANTAYWTEAGAYGGCCLVMGAGSVGKVSLPGGAVETAVSSLDNPGPIAAGDSGIAWGETWRIGRAPVGGGSAVTAVSGIATNMARIAISQSTVFVLDGDYIKAMPLSGGTIEKAAPSAGGAIDDFSNQSGDITADLDYVYWTMLSVAGPPVVRKLATAGGSPAVLASESNFVNPQDCYRRIAVVDQTVYWSEGSMAHPVGCAIRRVSVNGGAVTTLVDQAFMTDFTVDGVDVYYAELDTGSIRKLPAAGGNSVLVASDVGAWVLANDADELYWLDLQLAEPAGMVKTDGPTDWVSIPLALSFDSFLAFDALFQDSTGFYVAESQTGSIYRIY